MQLTEFLAIYGATLSTGTAVWSYFRAKPQVRVRLVFALETVEGELKSGVGISIQNVSALPVHMTHVSLLYPYKRSTFGDKLGYLIRFKQIPRHGGWCHSSLSLSGVEDGCPVSIEPGKSHWIFVRNEVLYRLLEEATSRRIRAVAQDALWRNTYSKVFKFTILHNE